MSPNTAALLYLVSGVLFILALRGLSSPATSRQGNLFGMIGMGIAIVTTLAAHPPAGVVAWILVLAGVAIGGGIGAVIARQVPMTAMPELVAAFHSLVGMAAVLVAASALYAPGAFDIGRVGAMLAAALTETTLGKTMGVLAVALAAVNVFGGFLVTQRMLEMFKKKEKKAPTASKGDAT